MYFMYRSLEEMTQEGLEEIFQQYAQTIEAFRPIKSINPYQDDEDDFFDDDDDGQGDDLWIADDEYDLPPPPTPPHSIPSQDQKEQEQTTKTNSIDSVSSIFSQPNMAITTESVADKPLPANPILNEEKQVRRFSGNKNRLSWTSDTGITSSAVSQHLANELMNLFDMDFAVDIKINTAPKLPELPFRPRRKSQQRQSQDMLTSLLPAFEKIALENSSSDKPKHIIQSVPQRSSSLRHRQELEKVQSPVQPTTPPAEKSISKKKSILRLASLMTGKKHHSKKDKESSSSPETSPTKESIKNTPRKTSTSTVDSATSSSSYSSWSSLSDSADVQRAQKPLPDTPGEHKQHRKKKRRSAKASSKRKSIQQSIYDGENTNLSRSKSAFIKIVKPKKQTKQIRRTSSAKNLSDKEYQQLNIDFHTTSQELYSGESIDTMNDQHSFVKKVTSFHWRMKSRNKPVEV